MSFRDFIAEQEANKKEEENDKVMGTIIEYFSTHDKPNDEEIHKMAEDLNIEPDKFEEKIYSILTGILNAGKYKENPVEPDPEELKKGIKVEMEHTTIPAISRRIALDHLSEKGAEKYYTELEKMEKKFKE